MFKDVLHVRPQITVEFVKMDTNFIKDNVLHATFKTVLLVPMIMFVLNVKVQMDLILYQVLQKTLVLNATNQIVRHVHHQITVKCV